MSISNKKLLDFFIYMYGVRIGTEPDVQEVIANVKQGKYPELESDGCNTTYLFKHNEKEYYIYYNLSRKIPTFIRPKEWEALWDLSPEDAPSDIAYIMSQASRCAYCGKEFKHYKEKTTEHIIPKSHGGSNKGDNIVVTCLDCNQHKSNMSLSLFRRCVNKDHIIEYLRDFKDVVLPSGVDYTKSILNLFGLQLKYKEVIHEKAKNVKFPLEVRERMIPYKPYEYRGFDITAFNHSIELYKRYCLDTYRNGSQVFANSLHPSLFNIIDSTYLPIESIVPNSLEDLDSYSLKYSLERGYPCVEFTPGLFGYFRNQRLYACSHLGQTLIVPEDMFNSYMVCNTHEFKLDIRRNRIVPIGYASYGADFSKKRDVTTYAAARADMDESFNKMKKLSKTAFPHTIFDGEKFIERDVDHLHDTDIEPALCTAVWNLLWISSLLPEISEHYFIETKFPEPIEFDFSSIRGIPAGTIKKYTRINYMLGRSKPEDRPGLKKGIRLKR